MARKSNDTGSDIQEQEVTASSAVVSTTESAVKEADKTSYPVANDAEVNDPPVRTNRPDVPIAQSLASGAGEHQPPDPKEVHPDGRPVYDEQAASEKNEVDRVGPDEASSEAADKSSPSGSDKSRSGGAR